MSLQLIQVRKRLAFLSKLLTKPGVDEELCHADRQQLLEETEELLLKEREMKQHAGHGGRI